MSRISERLKRLLAVGKEHYDSGDFARAEPVLASILEENKGFADIYNMLGVIYHDRGEFSQAQQYFEEALRINPEYTEAALNLSVTYNDLGKYGDARRVYAHAMAQTKKEPRSIDKFARGKIANMHADLGSAYHGIGLYEEAIAEYEKALLLCPNFVDIRTRLGSTLRDMGHFDDAIREFTTVKQENRAYLDARIQLGVTYYSAGRRDDAIQEWTEVLADDPDNKNCALYIQMVQTEIRRETGEVPTLNIDLDD